MRLALSFFGGEMSFKNEPYTKAMTVTPNDSADFVDGSDTVLCRGISVAVAGTVAWKDANGTTRSSTLLAAGVVHFISTKRIMATGTSATGISVYW